MLVDVAAVIETALVEVDVEAVVVLDVVV